MPQAQENSSSLQLEGARNAEDFANVCDVCKATLVFAAGQTEFRKIGVQSFPT